MISFFKKRQIAVMSITVCEEKKELSLCTLAQNEN